jgi:hypothetical protein
MLRMMIRHAEHDDYKKALHRAGMAITERGDSLRIRPATMPLCPLAMVQLQSTYE